MTELEEQLGGVEQPPHVVVGQDDEDEGEYAGPSCDHAEVEDGDIVRVVNEYACGVRAYDLGINPEVRDVVCSSWDDEHEAFCVWPSGTAMWLPIDQLEVAR